jgi:hypothetical protein
MGRRKDELRSIVLFMERRLIPPTLGVVQQINEIWRTAGSFVWRCNMRLEMVVLVVVLALAAFSTPAPAQVPSEPLSIHVEAVLGEPTGVGDLTVSTFRGTAVLTSPLVEGESEVNGIRFISIENNTGLYIDINEDGITPLDKVRCTGMVDEAGNGSGRCASSGEFEGEGTWAGRIDVDGRSLVVDIYLQVVCPRC